MAGKKRFDKKLMDTTEKKINEILQDNLEQPYSWDETDPGEPDVLLEDGTYLEVEVKRVWKDGDDFPWDTVDIPGRKYKYLRCQPLKFVLFNKSLTHAIVVDSNDICDSSWFKVKDTRYSKNEVFITFRLDKDEHIWPVEELKDAV